MKKIVSWIFTLLAASIMGQTLYFKFTAAPESVALHAQIGMEPYGRIAAGIAELIAIILLLIPASRSLGALMSLLIMSVAITYHLTSLGIAVQGDNGLLFCLAVTVFISSAIVLFIHRKELPFIGKTQRLI